MEIIYVATPVDEGTIHSTRELLGPVIPGSIREVVVDEVLPGAIPVVTDVTTGDGSVVEAGKVLLVVSGRPLLALPTAFPLYRDILPGDVGPDVETLQTVLFDLGFYSGTIDGQYGVASAAAVRALYGAAGHAPPTPDAERAEAHALAVEAIEDAALDTSDEQLRILQEAADRSAIASDTPVRRSEILSIQPGTVLESGPTLGSELGPGGALLRLRTGSPSATVRLNASDLDSVQVGQSVTVSPSTAPDQVADGTVESISAFRAATDEQVVPGYDMIIRLSDDALWQTVTEIALVLEGEEANASLRVPLTAVREDSEGTFVVVLPDVEQVDSGESDQIRSGANAKTERRQIEVLAADGRNAAVAGDVILGEYVVVAESR